MEKGDKPIYLLQASSVESHAAPFSLESLFTARGGGKG